MAISIKEKMDLKREAMSLKQVETDKSKPLGERMTSKRRRLEVIIILLGKSKEEPKTLSERFLAGEFNAAPADEFRKTLIKVDAEKLPMRDIVEGVIGWFESNPDKLAA